jgi:hypothetical protein
MFGRSNELWNTRAVPSARRSMISRCVGGSAVAVSAMRGTPGQRSCSRFSSRYSGRKSCPHLRHAVRLVDREQRHARVLEQHEEARRQQPLGRDVQEIQLAGERTRARPRTHPAPQSAS